MNNYETCRSYDASKDRCGALKELLCRQPGRECPFYAEGARRGPNAYQRRSVQLRERGRCTRCGKPNDRVKQGLATCSACARSRKVKWIKDEREQKKEESGK